MANFVNHELYQLYNEPKVISRLQLNELGGWGSCLDKMGTNIHKS